MAAMPSTEERRFVAELNQLSKDHSSATFGHPGRLVISKARRQLAFASSAWMRWPDLGGGDLRTTSVEDWHMAKVDPSCGFWQDGQQKYLSALTTYMDALRSLSLDAGVQRDLLSDLGFHIVENFISEQEEVELMEYWGPESPVFAFGTDEQISGRRWFNYGPILPRTTSGTTKSTLTVIPARLGEMPPVVLRQRLQERIRAEAERLVGRQDHPALARQFDFDQMYVNYYDAAARANIEFHHDNHTCMLGAIAGVSLMSACDLQLRPLDPSIVRPPLKVILPRRSLFFLSGLSRWHLQHAILRMPESRLSLTFRTVDRSCTREQELWDQGWDCLEAEEAQNAVWPLVQPDGAELHLLFSSPEMATSSLGHQLRGEAAACSEREREAVRRVPRRSTVVVAEEKAPGPPLQVSERSAAPAPLAPVKNLTDGSASTSASTASGYDVETWPRGAVRTRTQGTSAKQGFYPPYKAVGTPCSELESAITAAPAGRSQVVSVRSSYYSRP